MTNKGWKTSRLRKQVLAAVLVGGMAVASPFAMPTAEASFGDWSGLLGDVIGGVARAESARSYFLALGNNPVVQNQLYLSRAAKDSTANRAVDEKAVSMVDVVMKKMIGRGDFVLRNNSLPFRWKVVPNDEFNASCDAADVIIVYDGAIKEMNYQPDEVAGVLGHEMAHGYNQHLANDAKKGVLANLVGNLAYNAIPSFGIGDVLPAQLINYVAMKNVPVATEKRADCSGFFTMASAGFNPGGMPAAMARMSHVTTYQGDFADFFSPSDHPSTRARINAMAALMTDYGLGHPSVQNANDVYFDKERLLIAEEDGGMDAEEMAYLIAGGIAKGFHDNAHITEWNFRKLDDGTIDFLTNDPAYRPLKDALKADSEAASRFESLVEAAYVHDAKTNARMTYPKEEKKHIEDMRAERERQAKRTENSVDKVNNGEKYMQLGLADLAEKEFTRAGKLDPKNSVAKSGMAAVLASRGSYQEAMQLANEAVTMAPDVGENYVNRAAVYRAMGNLDEALADCNRALSASASATTAYRIAGEIFDEQGAKESALQEFRAYHEAAPQAKDIPSEYLAQLQ